MTQRDLLDLVRDVPNFPKRGIMFKDITPLLRNAEAFDAAVKAMAAPWRSSSVQVVVGVEARGFILGAALARELKAGFVMARKHGKLPWIALKQDGQSEYGDSNLEVHKGDTRGRNTVIVDDVLATGGTLAAAIELVRRDGAHILGCSVLLEIEELGGREALGKNCNGAPVNSALKV